jgi:hypothetical protein
VSLTDGKMTKVKAERLCVFCEHLDWDYDSGGGGCETCGYGGEGNAEMRCGKHHWAWGGYAKLVDYRQKILKAVTCKDYKQVKA